MFMPNMSTLFNQARQKGTLGSPVKLFSNNVWFWDSNPWIFQRIFGLETTILGFVSWSFYCCCDSCLPSPFLPAPQGTFSNTWQYFSSTRDSIKYRTLFFVCPFIFFLFLTETFWKTLTMYHCRALFIFLSGRRQGDIVLQISLCWSLHIFTGSSPDHCLALSANKIFFDKKVKRAMGTFHVSSTLLSF